MHDAREENKHANVFSLALPYLVIKNLSHEFSQNFPSFFLMGGSNFVDHLHVLSFCIFFLSLIAWTITSVRCPMLTKISLRKRVLKTAFLIGSCHFFPCNITNFCNFKIKYAHVVILPRLNFNDRCNYLFLYRQTFSNIFLLDYALKLSENEQDDAVSYIIAKTMNDM